MTGASACNRLYKREALGDLRFPDGRINEDEFFVLRAYERMKRIAYMDCETYFYIKRENSTTTSAFSLKMLDYVRNGRENVELAARKSPGLLPAAEYKYCKSMLWCYVNLRKIKGDAGVQAACRQLRGEIRQHKGMALSNPHLGLRLKVLTVAICFL